MGRGCSKVPRVQGLDAMPTWLGTGATSCWRCVILLTRALSNGLLCSHDSEAYMLMKEGPTMILFYSSGCQQPITPHETRDILPKKQRCPGIPESR